MSSTVAQDSLIGQVIGGKYRIDRVIGQGGFGVVYGATHLGLGKPRAVKVLKQLSEDRRKRLELEARALAKLDHPYIVAVVDVGVTEDGNPYLVMEYVEGRSLGELITTGGTIHSARTLSIMKCVCSAVHYAHDEGIIHRDLKPSNIIVQRFSGEGETAKVLDFGLAKFLHHYVADSASEPTTESGMIIGTVEYLSPEQCSGQPIDQRSDIYSLGVIMYQMLTGRLPFHGETPFAILTQHINASPPSLHGIIPGLPSSVDRVVSRALAKNPDQRQQTALQLREEFEQALLNPNQGQLDQTERITSTERVSRARPAGERRRWVNARSLWMLAGVFLLAFSAWRFYPRPGLSPAPWEIPDPGWRESFVLENGSPKDERWAMPESWTFVSGNEGPNDGALAVRGPDVGMLLTPKGTSLYDFVMKFSVTPDSGNKIAWVVRAQGLGKYYLFVLSFPRNRNDSAHFQGYACHPSYPQPRPFIQTADTITDFGPVQPGDVYWVDLTASGYQFQCEFTRDRGDTPTPPRTIQLEPEPQDRIYRYGSIGFSKLEDEGSFRIELVHLLKAVGPSD